MAGSSRSKKKESNANQSNDDDDANLFKYMGFKGKDATFMKVMVENILPSKPLKKALAAIQFKTEQRLNNAATIMQTWYRGITGKSDALAYKMNRMKEAKLQKHSQAGIVIQSAWRAYLGKSIAHKIMHA